MWPQVEAQFAYRAIPLVSRLGRLHINFGQRHYLLIVCHVRVKTD